ncbi:MAG: GIY-YIG nuclease family protein [Acidobacteriota bacterium]
MDEWWLYIIRSKDKSLYTGITLDVSRRFKEHKEGKGSKYLRGRGPLQLVFKIKIGSRGLAQTTESKIKKMTKPEKESLITNPERFNELF